MPPISDVKPGHTRLYLSKYEVAEVLQLSRNHVGRHIKEGLLPTPDVWVARYLHGWDEDRIRAFGVDFGLIDGNGNKLHDLLALNNPKTNPTSSTYRAEHERQVAKLRERHKAEREQLAKQTEPLCSEQAKRHKQERNQLVQQHKTDRAETRKKATDLRVGLSQRHKTERQELRATHRREKEEHAAKPRAVRNEASERQQRELEALASHHRQEGAELAQHTAGLREEMIERHQHERQQLAERHKAERAEIVAGPRHELAERHKAERAELAAKRQRNTENARRARLRHVQEMVAARYGGPTKTYLSSSLAAAVWGHEASSTSTARHRKRFIPADVVVSTRFGWAETNVIEHGLQTGRMDEARIDVWAVERTTRHGLPADEPWVRERARQKPTLAKTLQDAGIPAI